MSDSDMEGRIRDFSKFQIFALGPFQIPNSTYKQRRKKR